MLILVSAVLLEATSLIQYYFAKQALEEEATHRAGAELENTSLKITNVMDQVQTAVQSNLWAASQELGNADSLYKITRRLVADNPVIIGSAVALDPGYRTARGSLFAPYSYLDGEEILSKQLGSDEYNYLNMEWYYEPLNTHEGHWSEPYYDAGGGEMLMTTYSCPIQDKKGRQVGVLTADLSLDWLTELVGEIEVYPEARSMLISKRGMLMVFPDSTLVLQTTVQDAAVLTGDPAALDICNEMLAGRSGMRTIKYNDIQRHVFFAPVNRAGWSMAIIIPSNEIFRRVRNISTIVLILQLLGLAILAWIIQRTAKNLLAFKKVSESKDRIENELRIASAIQMSMLPKIFPPYPDRHDIDIFGTLMPAKEVGGDLFDYYIRDDRLFFCIGDVSGKGVPASLVMAVTRSLFRTVSGHESNPARIVTQMNESMSQDNESNMFVTFFIGALDLSSGLLRYCNAGHNAPLLLTEEGVRKIDVNPNCPIGIDEQMRYGQQEVMVPSGATLFLYTDGLTEAENARRELFGEERLLATARTIAREPAREQVAIINEAVHNFVGAAPQSDDLTMLSIKFLGDPENITDRHLLLQNDIQQIPQLADFIETIAEESGISQALAMSLNLALEEAVTNVILYAYPEGTEGLVDIEAIIRKHQICFNITDSGQPFDPTQVAVVDTTLPLEERPIGGLGIHIVRSIMDEVFYKREGNQNFLRLIKNL